jgi:hypothetical protein
LVTKSSLCEIEEASDTLDTYERQENLVLALDHFFEEVLAYLLA